MHLETFYEAIRPARAIYKDRYIAVTKWLDETGRRTNADVVLLIVIARAESFLFRSEQRDFWTRPIVYDVLSCDVCNWCSFQRVLIPEGVPLAFDDYLRFLDGEGLFADGSDPLETLLEPIRCYGGVGPPVDRCTCYEPTGDARPRDTRRP
jgi:hypothetical protein